MAKAPSKAEELPLSTAKLIETAQSENQRAARQRQARADFARRGERLNADVPPCFFRLAEGLRDAVRRFNAGITEDAPGLLLHYHETPAVSLKDGRPGQELLCSVRRGKTVFDLTLRYMSRSNGGDLPIIEGHGTYVGTYVGVETQRVLLRIEGWVEGGKTIFWASLDFQRYAMDLAELPDRIVMSIVRHMPELLHRDLNPPPPRPLPQVQEE